MTDIVERLRKYDEESFVGKDIHEAADEIEQLREQLAACQKDAERYRWVREHCELIEYADIAVQEDQDNLDAAIDAAIEGTN